MSVEIPPFIRDKDIVIASSYRREDHFRETQRVSALFSDSGFAVYPLPDSEPIYLDVNFVFLGGGGGLVEKKRLERLFLEAIKRARFMYVVATNGYVGHSTGTEIAYALAVGTPILSSEKILNFGREIDQDIITIIEKHHPPIVPVEQIEEMGTDILDLVSNNNRCSSLGESEKRKIFDSLLGLFRTLRH
ncbi:MAG: hypothetical protein A3C30_04935 [Candidatus Levybacteria bacterium RIFCSPHIGHO2_02_FULL_40_18]|nr:MAG: hypothetical protein A2869_02595 [Candidatus Levybacteria bacterium RIFCSPHIGHO2_01_FULL_40_58]OGH26420.1 MAG: hypothetical protein A3C30_04935 [Candidatus Levybacteria bacterium RIFCSPHIGHO2_02_FULL_40_18]OGH31868.1 MAG: hypothetical protein A3E43_00735 [Candidatus Levybacteria bacterium RIFCSPHIGHO2_12_FULL_40_31]OGH40501.1 MAG: hypothetical protein A2894_01240 [Candidatus Levybacteria bacterium RIFCSPLOWO2_01_FULL_40_64]OGH49261.1 MAG: hypothetical protein A3I54_01280 [Candidatus Lev